MKIGHGFVQAKRYRYGHWLIVGCLFAAAFMSARLTPVAQAQLSTDTSAFKGAQFGQPVDANCQSLIPQSYIDRLAELGTKWVRVNLIGAGDSDNPCDYTNLINSLHGKNFKIIGLLNNELIRQWRADQSEWQKATYATTFSQRAKAAIDKYPTIDVWEIWNEPNFETFALQPCAFAGLLSATRSQVGSSVKLISGGVLSSIQDFPKPPLPPYPWSGAIHPVKYMQAVDACAGFDLLSTVSGIGIHPYVDKGAGLRDFIDAFRTAFGSEPQYITEFGWTSGADAASRYYQCKYLVDAFDVVENRSVVKAAVWFLLESYNGYGLYDDHDLNQPRPAAEGYRTRNIDSCGTPPAEAARLDLVIAVDTTGSMASSIAAVKAAAADMTYTVAASNLNYRIGLVEYKDHGDTYVSRIDLPFSTNTTAIVNAINALSVNGGGDTPEAVFSGVMTAVGFPWRNGAKKAIILMGDAPPHDPEQVTNFTSASVIAAANAVDPASIYPILIGGDSGMRTAFQALASGTGGQSFEGGADVGAALVAAISAIARSPNAQAGGPYTGIVNRALTFNAGASRDPDGSIVRYEWDVDGNGSYDRTSTSPSLSYTYTAPFSGTVTLRVTDNDGRTGVGTAAVRVVGGTNIAPSGTAYRWFSLYSATSDYQKAAAPGLTDGNLTADVELANGSDDNSNVYEGAGVVWTSAKSISAVTFINGSCDQYRNGVFVGNVKVQVSTDGTTWTAAPWTILPQYPADSCGLSPTAAGQRYIFNGPALSNIKGVRVVGLVHTAGKPASWHAHVTEVQVFQ